MSWTEQQRRANRAKYERLYKSPVRHEQRGHIVRADVDLIRQLSDVARDTRRPGQTLQARLNELRRECGA